MIDKFLGEQILKKILASKGFAKSKTDNKFLSYLVNASIDGKLLNESIIAEEVFCRDSNFNPSEDPIVRVHSHSVRKKLDRYYLDEGKDDNVRLVLEKGGYYVSLIKVKHRKIFSAINLSPLFIIILFLFACCIISSIYFYAKYNNVESKLSNYQKIQLDDAVWSDFLNEKPTMIIFGDHFFYTKHIINSDKYRRIRDSHINSIEQLNELISQNQDPNIEYAKSSVPYISKHGAWSLQYILPIFFSAHKDVIFRLSSELNWEDIQQNNIIFIGSIKTLGILDQLIPKLKIRYSLFPHKIYLVENESDTVATYYPQYVSDTRYYKDYTIVAKMPGPQNNSIFLFTSYYFVGVMEAIINFADPVLLDQFKSDLSETSGSGTSYFQSLFEVVGYDKTNLSSKIIHLLEIDPRPYWHQ